MNSMISIPSNFISCRRRPKLRVRDLFPHNFRFPKGKLSQYPPNFSIYLNKPSTSFFLQSMEAGDSSTDEDDSIPLSQILRFPKTPRTSIPNPSKTLKKFNKNDIVWAKTSPQTWSPAKIAAIVNKSKASVSLFGSNDTHVVNLSHICGFEESYGAMAKIAGPELSDEIEIALEELGRRAATGLMCSCRKSPNFDDPIGFNVEFEPKEMLGFVKEMALCAWVGLEGVARAVKLSAQVNGYRHYVSMCVTCGVDEGLFAEGLLGFLKDLAVCWGSDEWEDESVGCEVERILAYRRFVSVKPNWMFRQSLEVEDDSDSEVEGEGTVHTLLLL